MKTSFRSIFFSVFLFSILSSSSFSQSINSSVESTVNRLNTPTDIYFKPVDIQGGNLGFTHHTYQQFYQGIKVEGGILKIHEKNGLVTSTSGKEFKISSIIRGNITELEALLIAKKNINGRIYREDVDKNYQQFVQKVIVKQGTEFYETYKIDIYSVKPLIRKYVYVSSVDGQIIRVDNRIHTADANGTATTAYSGTQNIVTDSLAADTFRLRETGRGLGVETYNMQQGFFGGVDFIDDDNSWNNVNGAQDEVATDAHWAAEMFYDYFSTTFGRDSYDDAGAKLITNVHYGSNYGSAFWDGTSVSVGDGDGSTYGPLTTVDIICHEFSHGIIETTANLVFSAEPGALSESFSDIFATAVEFYAKSGSANWTIKEDAHLSGGADHSLANPKSYGQPDTYFGTNWATGSADNYGVHTNCGVQNYWFYLLTNGGSGTNDNGDSYSVSGIGITDAMAVAYRALTVYHTSNSQYSDARNYAIQAAEDLFGSCSTEVEAGTNAWYAVGVGAAYSTAPANANFSADGTYSCSIPFTVNFLDISTNAVNYDWDFGDGNTSTLASTANTYTAAGVYTVRLIVSGIGCSSSPDTMELVNYITVINGGGPVTASCSPSSSPTSTNYGITNVTFNSINKTSGYSSGEDYVDNTCSDQTTVDEGALYPLSISTGFEYAYAWIDYNNDGSFTASEQVYASTTRSTSHNITVTIVGGATLNTPLRMRVGSSYYTLTDDGCAQPYWGQYEDYSVTLVPNTSPPVADFTANITTINTGGNINFFDASAGAPTDWNWSFTGASQPSSTSQNPTGITYNTVGSYEVKLVVTNSFGADSITKYNYINVVNSIDLCSGTATTNAGNGTLYDSGGATGQYSNNENCSLLIDPGCATPITLSFSYANIESGWDYLYVYDGNSTAGTLLLTASGNTTPSSVVANSGQMFIQFISDASVIDNGFEASWTSAASGGTPAAAFSVSDTTPPFNTSVTFNDLTTNMPNQWQWDFGDGNYSSSQNPAHAYGASGNYTVTLIATNCSSSDTTSLTVTVTPPPLMTYAPSSITTTLTCGDSTSVPITFYNSGAGTLNIVGYGEAGLGLNNDFYDGFESGNISSWVDQGGSYTKQVVSTTSGGGTYSLELQDGGSDFYDGIMHTFSPSTPTEISFKVMSPSTNSWGCMITFGDATTTSDAGIGNFYINFGGTMYYNGSSSTSYSFVQNQWTLIEYKNIDFTTSTFDLYVDGVLVQAGLIFGNTGLTNIDRVYLSGFSSGVISYFDDITVGVSPISSWLSLDDDTAQVATGDSAIYTAKINSTGYYAGTYSLDLTFESNDSANPLVTIPVQMVVEGTPNTSLSASCLAFGSVLTGGVDSDSIVLYNTGCDTLFVSGYSSTNTSFVLDTSNFYVLPNDSILLTVNFTPNNVQSFTDTIVVFDNANNPSICLTGTGIAAPTASVSTSGFTVNLDACGDSANVSFLLYNSGGSSLDYTISGGSTNNDFYDGFESGNISSWVDQGGSYTKQATNSQAANGTFSLEISNGTSSVYDGIMHTFSSATPTELSFKVRSPSNSGLGCLITIGDANTSSTSGLGIFYIDFSGNFNFSGGSFVQSSTFVPNQWVTITYKNIDYTNKTLDFYVDGNLVQAGLLFSDNTLTSLDRIYISGYSTGNTAFIDEIIIGESAVSWIVATPASGSVSAPDSTQIDLAFNSAGLAGGQYTADIIISSNDPVNSQIIVPCTLNVSNNPCSGFSSNITSCSGDVDFTDETYNSPTSWQWNFGDGNASTLQNPTNTYSAIATYTVQLIACNSSGCDTTINQVTVNNIGGPTAPVCVPQTAGYCCGMGISNVSFNTINNTTADGVDGYQDYTCSATTTIYEGQSYTLNVTTGVQYEENVMVWIDYNNNGDLEASEIVMNSTNLLTNHAIAVTPAIGTAVLNTPLRMRVASDYYVYTITSSCLDVSYGQYEDYSVVIIPNNVPPVTSFTSTISDPCNGQVFFTDLSTNSPTSWYWEFGDGNSSTAQFPSNTYAGSGIYTVSLTATNAFGSDTYTSSATINTMNTDFTYSGNLVPGGTINFFSNSPGAIAWSWNFDNGTNSSLEDPIIAYTAAGVYNVSLAATNGFGCTSSVVYAITIADPAAPTPDYSVSVADQCAGEYLFTDLSTGNPTSWFWNFDDGTTSTLQNPSHTFVSSGVFDVSLTATNGLGSNTSVQSVTVTAPDVGITYIGSLVINNTIQFIGSSSGNVTSWLWSFGDGFGTSIQNPSYSYTSLGEYEVILEITDDNGCTIQAVDTLVIKLDDGIEENNLHNNVGIYPNPTNGKFFVEVNSQTSKSVQIDIVNVLGQSVLSHTYSVNGDTIVSIDVSNHKSGVYFVTVTDIDNLYSVTKRIILN